MAGIEMRYKPGSGFYTGIPARDLTAEEVRRFGREFLLSLGLYAEVEQPKPKRAKELETKPEPFEAEFEED